MGPVFLLFQVALCVNLVYSQETFSFGAIHPTYQQIKGLPNNQQGFIIRHPNFQQDNSGILSQEQQVHVRAQEEFRRAVAEANKKRINGGDFRPSQELPLLDTEDVQQQQFESNRQTIQTPKAEVLEQQQLPLQDELIQATSPVEKFESLRTPESELVLPETGGNNFNDAFTSPQEFDAQKFREQAENAKYSFKSAVSDSVNDNSHIRQESRDGLKLTGLYSYSDGYFKRTVHYVADEKGYRVVKEESEPIGSGPQIDPHGKVDVSSQVGGSTLQYTIKGENLPSPFKNKRFRN